MSEKKRNINKGKNVEKLPTIKEPTPYKEIKLGLKQKILKATSEAEINTLLSEGAKYSNVSSSTQNKWKSAVQRRMTELKSGGGSNIKNNR